MDYYVTNPPFAKKKKKSYQVMATNPRYIYPEDVPEQDLEKAWALYLRKHRNDTDEGEEFMEKKENQLLQTSIKDTFVKSNCLMEQEFVVGQFEGERVDSIVGDVEINNILRWNVGEFIPGEE